MTRLVSDEVGKMEDLKKIQSFIIPKMPGFHSRTTYNRKKQKYLKIYKKKIDNTKMLATLTLSDRDFKAAMIKMLQ